MARTSSAGQLRSIGALILLFYIFAIAGANPINFRSESGFGDVALLGQDALLVDETPIELGSAPEDQGPPPAGSTGAAAKPVPGAATTPQPPVAAKPQPVVSVPAAVGGKKDDTPKPTEAAKKDPADGKVSTPQPKSTSPPPTSGYAPTKGKCDGLPSLVRSTAKGRQTLGQPESDYIRSRSAKASLALRRWLGSALRDEGERSRVGEKLPTLALTISGGGLRSMLLGAGVVQALDGGDSNGSVSGLYQAMSYHAGLSGGAWLLSSIIGNDFSSISGVARDPWATTLLENSSLIMTENIEKMPELKALIKSDISAKARAGFRPTPADAWGRASACVTLRDKFGAYQRLSDVRKSEKFRGHDAPYPIITALGMEEINGKSCDVVAEDGDYATQYEFSPHEFGSWQKGVEGFIPTELLGTAGVDGKPKNNVCVKNFDNLGFVMGVSSVRFNEECGQGGVSLVLLPSLNEVLQPEDRVDSSKKDGARRQLYAPIPNPFKSYGASPKVSKYDELYLFDGGQCKYLRIVRVHSHDPKQTKTTPSGR
jgi:lysophospholipase